MATWTAFIIDQNESGYISLEKVVEIAKAVAGERHHFKFIQLPYNIKLTNANERKNQKVRNKLVSPIEAAEELEIFTTVSAPLAQGEGFNNKMTSVDLLSYVINTKGVLSAMVGMKKVEHVIDNLKLIKI